MANNGSKNVIFIVIILEIYKLFQIKVFCGLFDFVIFLLGVGEKKTPDPQLST